MQLTHIQLPIEIITLFLLALLSMRLKSKYPNALFPAVGVEVYLPPSEQEMSEYLSKKKVQLPIKLMSASTKQFTRVPFADELDITMMFLFMVSVEFVLMGVYRVVCSQLEIVPVDTQLMYYLILIVLFMIIRNCEGITIFR
jgi:hypothetical protein